MTRLHGQVRHLCSRSVLTACPRFAAPQRGVRALITCITCRNQGSASLRAGRPGHWHRSTSALLPPPNYLDSAPAPAGSSQTRQTGLTAHASSAARGFSSHSSPHVGAHSRTQSASSGATEAPRHAHPDQKHVQASALLTHAHQQYAEGHWHDALTLCEKVRPCACTHACMCGAWTGARSGLHGAVRACKLRRHAPGCCESWRRALVCQRRSQMAKRWRSCTCAHARRACVRAADCLCHLGMCTMSADEYNMMHIHNGACAGGRDGAGQHR